jgi:hypothetical protein
MNSIKLSDECFDEILKISQIYYREAQKCNKTKAFLAGCIMIGAALEAILLAFANCYVDEGVKAANVPKEKNGKVKPLIKWSLNNLLKVADECKWLPRGLLDDQYWDQAKAQIGDYCEVTRQIRNFVHPAKYASDKPDKRITKKYLKSLFEIINVTIDYLLKKIYESIREEIKNEE